MIAVFACLAVAGGLIYFRSQKKIQALTTFLLVIASTYYFSQFIQPEETQLGFFALVSVFITANYVAGIFVSNKWLNILLPLSLIGGLFFAGNTDFQIGEYVINFHYKSIISLVLIGYAIGALKDAKLMVLSKLTPSVKKKGIDTFFYSAFIGLASIFAVYFAHWMGFFLLAVGMFAFNAFRNADKNYAVISLMLLAFAGGLVLTNEIESLDLLVGKMLAGLFIGGATVALAVFGLGMRNRPLSLLLGVLGVLLIIFVSFLDAINPAYGGFEVAIIALYGVAMANLLFAKTAASVYLYPILMVTVLLLQPVKKTEILPLMDAAETPIVNVEEKDQFDAATGSDLSTIQPGTYKIDKASSVLSFHLGKKGGVTNGEITQFEGTFQLPEDLENATFDVTLYTSNLTTFNRHRDESVHGSEYLNESEFPAMKFVSTSLKKDQNGEYIAKGSFTLLGVTNNQDVRLKLVNEKDGNLHFVGKSSIDRRNHGMESAPSEGNIIDFTFEILLIK